jgi:hypothetical protein
MIKFKSKDSKSLSAILYCDVLDCKVEADKLWASSESDMKDLCFDHYLELRGE